MNFNEKDLADIERMSELIKKNIKDLTDLIIKNLDENDDISMLACFSALTSVLSYFEFKIRENGFSDEELTEVKNGAEEYVLELIADELNTMIQKSGNA